MSKINKIKLSGTTYDVEDANASKAVELTQAEYDALVQAGTVDPNTFYIITDAQAVDISEYWTSGQTQSAIDSAVSGKQDTLSAGTGIDITNNVISATGGGGGGINSVTAEYDDTGSDGEFLINVNSGQSYSQIFKVGSGLTVTEDGDDVILSTSGGGSITIDPSLDSSSTNAVANSAITNAINSKVTDIIRGQANWAGSGVTTLNVNYTGTSETTRTFCASINNKQILTGPDYSKANQFSLVETSAITTSITSSSTDAQVPSAKAVNDKLGGLSIVKLTQTEYDNLGTKDSNTLYVITTS